MINEDIQNELEALAAIYEGDFESRPPLWNQPCFAIKLKPNLGNEVYCKCTLKFNLSKGYPKVIPKVDVENVEGLSTNDLKELNVKITEVARANIGEVMSHEIISMVQEFLEERNQKPVTFYEAMINREKRESEAMLKLRYDTSTDPKATTSETITKESVEDVILLKTKKDEVIPPSSMTSAATFKSIASPARRKSNPPVDVVPDKPKETIKETPKPIPPAPLAMIEIPLKDNEIVRQTSGGHPTPPVKSWLQTFMNQKDDDDDEDESDNGSNDQQLSDDDVEDNLKLSGMSTGPTTGTETSRYKLEFNEISLLGSGASGEVWKAKNKLDRRLYAVKKINLNSRENALNYNKIRREVTTISGLLHKYIVRYYAAWIEQQESFGKSIANENESEEEDSFGFDRTESSLLQDIDKEKSSTSKNYLEKISKPMMSNSYSFNFVNDDLFDFESDDMNKKSSKTRLKKGRNADISFVSSLDLSSGYDNSEDIGLRYEHSDGKLSALSRSSTSSTSSSDSYDSESESDDSSSSDSYSDNDNEDDENGSKQGSEAGTVDKQQNSKLSVGKEAVGIAHSRICRFLFIQMEYCFSTLREVIDKGSLWQQPAEILKLLKQLLEALAYIHGRRVIHRDLKPANIFLDSEGNIKVGDFGLATSGNKNKFGATLERIDSNDGDESTANSPIPPSHHSPGKMAHVLNNTSTSINASNFSDTLTGGIGTAMYSAPEQIFDSTTDLKILAKNKEKAYNEKADMFSLGIILFEMCHKPFDTAMERYVILQALRTKGEVPTYFKSGGTEGKKMVSGDESIDTLRSIILWLVQQEPSKRPSAMDLLASSLISNKNDNADVYLKEITEALCRPNTTAAHNVLSVLFNHKPEKLEHSGGSAGRPYSELQLGGIESMEEKKLTKVMEDEELALNNNIFVNDQAISFELKALQNSLKLLHPRVISSLSHNVRDKSVVVAANKKNSNIPYSQIAVSLQYAVALKKLCTHIFESHGAVEYIPSLLQLRSTSIAEIMTEKNVMNDYGAQLLDRSGAVVVLPTDLISPYARQTAFLNIKTSQRFQIDRVYSASNSNSSSGSGDNKVILSSEHPQSTLEAVYDVILPAAETPSTTTNETDIPFNNKVLSDVEVLSPTARYFQTLQSILPDYALRIGDSRIIDSIIQLCACPSGASSSISFGDRAKQMLDSIDRIQLMRVISVAPDCSSVQDALSLLTDLQLPKTFESRFIPFLKLISAQTIGSDFNNPIKLLELLEKEFEQVDVIVDLSRQNAAAESPSIKRKTLASAVTETVISAKEIESEALKNKTNKTKFPKPNAPINAPTAPTVAAKPTPLSMDPLNLNNIGVKPNKKAVEAPIVKKVDASILHKQALTVHAPEANALDIYNKKEKKHVRIIFKQFRMAVIHMKRVLRSVLSLQTIKLEKPTTPSSSAALKGNARPRGNSIDESHSKHSHPNRTKGGDINNSSTGDLKFTEADTSGFTNVLGYNNFIIDLALDPRNRLRSPLSPFTFEGLYFVCEAYLPCHSNVNNNKMTVPIHKSASEMTLASLSNEDVMNISNPNCNACSSGNIIVNHSVNVSRRRHKGITGILAEGGQFDHLIRAYRKYLYSYSGNQASNVNQQVASGVRIKLDAILAQVIKFEARQMKIQKSFSNTKLNKLKSATTEVPSNRLSTLLHGGGLPDVLVVSAKGTLDHTAVELNEQFQPSSHSVTPVLQLLRLYGIRCSGYVHQLQGFVPGGAFSLCVKLGISYLIVVNESEQLKSRSVVSVVHCVADNESDIVKVIEGVKTPLNKLPTYLQSHYTQYCGLQLSTAHPMPTLLPSNEDATDRVTEGVTPITKITSEVNITDKHTKQSGKGPLANNPSTDVSTLKHAAVESVKVFAMIILETDNSAEHSKDKRVTNQKKKDSENLRLKVSNLMHSLWHCCTPTSIDSCNKLQVTLKAVGSKFSNGQIIAVEIPFVLVRSVNTIIIMKSHQSNVKDEFETLASSDLGKSYRKAMKQLITEYITYSRTALGDAATGIAVPTDKQGNSSSSGGSSNNAAGKNLCATTASIQVYVYSSIDDKIDAISFCPNVLINARIV